MNAPSAAAAVPPAAPLGIFSGVDNSVEKRDSELLCPICFDLLQEAHMTVCGHTFCGACITKALQQNLRCPKCNFHLESSKNLFPNFSLNELVCKYRRRLAQQGRGEGGGSTSSSSGSSHLRNVVLDSSEALSLPDVDYVIRQLVQKREQLQAQSVRVTTSRKTQLS
jgi:E3 ubiquitin-protein ligase RFWD2